MKRCVWLPMTLYVCMVLACGLSLWSWFQWVVWRHAAKSVALRESLFLFPQLSLLKGRGRKLASSSQPLVYAHGSGAVLWMLGSVTNEYPYQCICDDADLESWREGKLDPQEDDKSPVSCVGAYSSAMFPSDTYCDPNNK